MRILGEQLASSRRTAVCLHLPKELALLLREEPRRLGRDLRVERWLSSPQSCVPQSTAEYPQYLWSLRESAAAYLDAVSNNATAYRGGEGREVEGRGAEGRGGADTWDAP